MCRARVGGPVMLSVGWGFWFVGVCGVGCFGGTVPWVPPSVSVDRRPTFCCVCWLVVSAPSLGPSFLGHDSEAPLTGDAHACKAWPQRFAGLGCRLGVL